MPDTKTSFLDSVFRAIGFIALLWLIEAADRYAGLELYRLGVFPHQNYGLVGIVTAPLIHGGWTHLLSNSLALLVLITVLLYGFPRSALPALLLIWLGSGAGVWLFARENWHFGASGLTHGMMFYIFISGILRRDRLSVALALIVFFLHGGMIWSIFPQQPGISHESHFFGAAFGILAAFLFRHLDPPPVEKHFDWEDATDDGADGDDDADDGTRPLPPT